MSLRPLADSVPLSIGTVVYWDDRPGWRGVVVGLPSESTLHVDYSAGGRDRGVLRSWFTVERYEAVDRRA